mgnify:CR=1 FL=1
MKQLVKGQITSVKRLRQKNDFWKNKTLYLMMLPGLVFLIMFSYLPMFGTVIAFKQINFQQGIFLSPWVGFKNFKFLFSTKDWLVITRNTLGYNIAWLLVGLVLSVALAIALSELTKKFAAKVFQSILIMPYFLSWVIVAYIVLAFLDVEHGMLNRILSTVFGKETVNWYTEPKYWPVILTIVNLWKYMGYNSVVYLAAITGIDKGLYEAAAIDGANRWQQVRNITIPSIVPLMIIMSILAVGKIFNADFGLFYQVPLQSGALYPATNVIDTYVFNLLQSTGTASVGMSAAAGLYQSVCAFILVVTTNMIVRRIDADSALF